MKKNLCPNTYFNRELCGYIDLLFSADTLLTSLEKAYDGGSETALGLSRELDSVIADIMARRGAVSQILQAGCDFIL